ncbi:hypothetical protein ES708_17445 [subsurface metagenome]
MMAFIGVRISRDILERKVDFSLSDSSAFSFATLNSSWYFFSFSSVFFLSVISNIIPDKISPFRRALTITHLLLPEFEANSISKFRTWRFFFNDFIKALYSHCVLNKDVNVHDVNSSTESYSSKVERASFTKSRRPLKVALKTPISAFSIRLRYFFFRCPDGSFNLFPFPDL